MRDETVIAEGLFTFQIGGSERVGVDLALEFKRRGYRVVSFAFHDSDGPMRTQLEASGVRCLDMNRDRFSGAVGRALYLWKFWRMLRREKVSVLHVHHTAALILCGLPARLAGVRVLMTEHALQWREQRHHHGPARRYCRYASDITVVEPTQAEFFRDELGVATHKLHCVPNGVQVPARTAEGVAGARRKLGIAPEIFAFFYVGRLERIKDLGTLLQAFASLPPVLFSRSRLYLVGDGTERSVLEGKRDALRLTDHVMFLGARSDVTAILMAADAFVMSSVSEGMPMVLLEAMAAGVPCVATAVGGIPELLGNGRGLSVPPGDPQGLAGAMVSVAEAPELRARFVANALEHVRRHHALEVIVDRYLELLGLPPRAAESAVPG